MFLEEFHEQPIAFPKKKIVQEFWVPETFAPIDVPPVKKTEMPNRPCGTADTSSLVCLCLT
jgi:hypothetical protein